MDIKDQEEYTRRIKMESMLGEAKKNTPIVCLKKENPNRKTHILKLADQYWEAVRNQEKTFEVRYNDRGFEVGDRVKFRRVDSEEEMGLDFIITCLLTHDDFPQGVPEGWCVFSIERRGFKE